MGRILKLAENEYVEWSSIVDAPVTYIMTRNEAIDHYYKSITTLMDLEDIGKAESNWDKAHDAIDKAEIKRDFLWANRAGPNETTLTLEEIREKYKCTNP